MVARKKCLISIFLLFAFLLSGCSLSVFKPGLPEKGEWYCEELKMKISFEPRTSYINGFYLSNHGEYVDNDGDIVHFGIDSDYGCEVFSLWYVSGADVGYNFFHGECDYWDEDKMLVTELLDSEGDVKGASYTFVRIDK